MMSIVAKLGKLSEFGKIGFTWLLSAADKIGRTHTALRGGAAQFLGGLVIGAGKVQP
jgi:hypothetical protein